MFIPKEENREMLIAEDYAIELTKTGRGIMAEVKDAGSRFDGMYALGSTRICALAVLKAKIQEAAATSGRELR